MANVSIHLKAQNESKQGFSEFQATAEGAYSAVQEAGRSAVSALSSSFRTLGIQTTEEMSQQKDRINAAYNDIASAGKSSIDEIIRAEAARASAIENIDRQNFAARKENIDAVAAAFETLGIRSTASIETQKATINAAYDSIASSGKASADEIVRAEQARASAIEAIDRQNFAVRKENIDAVAAAFETLGIRSTASIETQKATINAAYDSIASSGKASADEIIRAEQARASAIEAIDRQNFSVRKENIDAVAAAFETLGIRSTASIETQKATINAAYDSIKSSGQASASEIVRAEQARASAIKEIDQQNFATRKGILDQLKTHWFAITGAITGAVASAHFFIGAAKDYLEAEQAANKLRIQVEGLGIAYNSVAPNIEKVVSAASQYARVQDNEVNKTLQELIFQSGNYAGSLENLNLTYDLAYQKGISNSETASLVGKAMAGNVEQLGRYIPELRNLDETLGKNATASEKTAYAFALLQEKSAGALGKMTEHEKTVRELLMVWHDFKEYVGGIVIWALDGLAQGFMGLRINILEVAAAGTWLTDALHITSGMYAGMTIEVEKAKTQLQDYITRSQTSRQATEGETGAVKEASGAHKQTTEQLAQETKARSDNIDGVKKQIEALAKYSDAVKTIGADVLKYAEAEFSVNIKLPGEGIADMSKNITYLEKMVAEAASLAGAVNISGVWRKNESAMDRYHELQKQYTTETTALHEQEAHALDALKVYMEGYGGVIDRVYGKQIDAQKTVMTELEKMVAKQQAAFEQGSATLNASEKNKAQELIDSWNEKLRAQSVVIIEAEKSQAEARLGMWQKYYEEVKTLHTNAIEDEKRKSLELLTLESQIATQRKGYAALETSVKEKAGLMQPLTELQQYYNTQKQLQAEYQTALQYEGQTKIDALLKYEQAASAAIKSVDNKGGVEVVSEKAAALTALKQIQAAQSQIVAEQNKLNQAKQDEISKVHEAASATQSAIATAQAMITQYTTQITELGTQMSDLKLIVDNSEALSAISEVQIRINAIPDVTYKRIVYEITGKGSAEKPISEKIEDIKAMFGSLSNIRPAVMADFSQVTSNILSIMETITNLGIKAGDLEGRKEWVWGSFGNNYQEAPWTRAVGESIKSSVAMYASLLSSLMEGLRSDSNNMQQSINQFSLSSSKFSGSTNQFEGSVQQMQIGNIITVMDKITNLGIQAGDLEGRKEWVWGSFGYNYQEAPWTRAIRESMASSLAMWKDILSVLMSSLKIGGTFDTGTTSVEKDMLAQIHKDEAVVPARYNVYKKYSFAEVKNRIEAYDVHGAYPTLTTQRQLIRHDDTYIPRNAPILSDERSSYAQNQTQSNDILQPRYGNRNTINITIGDIQIVARPSDNINDLARKLVKPIRDEFRKLQNII